MAAWAVIVPSVAAVTVVAPVVTVSLGFASRIPAQGEPPGSLLHEADVSMYQAKNQGRNQVGAAG